MSDQDMPPLDMSQTYGVAPLLGADSSMSQAAYRAWLEDHLWRPSQVAGLEVATDISPAEWIGDHLHPATFQVHMMVPDCFDACARVFYPIVGETLYENGRPVGNERITWTEMALRNGRTPHALMEQETIAPGETVYHCFAEDQADTLLPILERHTTSTSGWFLLWDGFGDTDPRPFQNRSKVEHPGRSYHLMKGPLAAYIEIANTPSYFWPADRAWCVTTDIDFFWAYVSGRGPCIDEIASKPVLDAYPTAPTNPARSGMDLPNDPNGTIPRLP